MRLATSDVEALVKRLAIGYGRALPPGELAAAVPVWRDVLDGVPWLELERAVDDALRTPGRFMPRPGEIRATALGRLRDGQRRQFGAPASETWARETWSEGWTPDGVPMLCSRCGGDVTFQRTGDTWTGHIRHRTTCGKAARIERGDGGGPLPASLAMPDQVDVAAKREEYHAAARDGQLTDRAGAA